MVIWVFAPVNVQFPVVEPTPVKELVAEIANSPEEVAKVMKSIVEVTVELLVKKESPLKTPVPETGGFTVQFVSVGAQEGFKVSPGR